MESRWYQIEATDALMKSLEDKDCHPIVVAPTGSGKSLMICDFIDRYMTKNPTARILVLSHVKEILRQDCDALEKYFEDIDIGLYSSGMKSRTVKTITVAGIQSVWRRPELFKKVSVIIVDECHLVTIKEDGMYRKLLSHLNATYVGFTATHFRLGHGYIHKGEGRLFNHIAYDMSTPEIFNKLVAQGYLTRLITKATIMKMKVKGLQIRAGDYSIKNMSHRFDRDEVTNIAVDEIIEFGYNYKKWLVFAIDIEHAEHVTKAFIERDVNACVIHSKMEADRDEAVRDLKSGVYRAVVNVGVLTMGLDVPDIDMIAVLRPTQSPMLHVQMIGRGLRVAPNKTHCLVLDFAGNTARLGPINDVIVKQKKKSDGTGTAPVKECPECQTLLHPTAKVCDVCGHEFKFKTSLSKTADVVEVVRTDIAQWHTIDQISYAIHDKAGKKVSMKVTYRIGLSTFNEWICFSHDGWSKYKADNWVRFRSPNGMPFPKDVYQLCEYAPWMKQPKKVLVNFSEKFPKIRDVLFETQDLAPKARYHT